jgi:hypothetical protein
VGEEVVCEFQEVAVGSQAVGSLQVGSQVVEVEDRVLRLGPFFWIFLELRLRRINSRLFFHENCDDRCRSCVQDL